MKRNLNQKINIWVKRAVGIYLTAALMIAVPTYADVIPPAPGPAAVAQNPGTAVQNPGAAAQNPGGAALQDPTSTAEESYLGGAELTLLAPATQSQNLSCVIQTKAGSLIVVDGGLREDAPHLIETIKAKGGRVSAWLITHPHSDHIGALTEILNTQPIPVEIDNIYYSFLEREFYQRGEHMGRMDNLDNLLAAFNNVAPEKLHPSIDKGQQIQVDEVTINVMNKPFRSLHNTFNNSSVAYRLDLNGKRILFLGDMGWDAGQNLLKKNKPEDLKADIVQMAHHGQDGVEMDVYRVIKPEICLWPTPDWLWDNVKNGVVDAGPWKTVTVRKWMEELGVSLHNTFNNSSVAYRLDLNGKRILFLGDMGWDAGQNLLKKNKPEDLKADIVQMAHHGQDGVEMDVYRVIKPEICLWPTPDWLWDNVKNGVVDAGPWKTVTVRKWMEELGVKRNLCVKDGDQVLR